MKNLMIILGIALAIHTFTKVQSQGLKIYSGGVIKTSGNPIIEIKDGNFSNSGYYSTGSESLRFSGNTNGKIEGTSTINLYNLTINNSNGITQACSNLIINKSMKFLNGILYTGSNILILSDDVVVTGAGANKFIDGYCRKIGNDAFIFPIGNDNKYAPMGISAPLDITDHFTASYYKENPNPLYNVTLKAAEINNVSTSEYWILDLTKGNSSVSVTLSWDALSFVSETSGLVVTQWEDGMWRNRGNTGITGDISSGTITSEAVTKFSPFTLGSISSNNPLPIVLLNFDATCNNEKVNIQWSTASEINCDYFLVEKMHEGGIFNQLATIPGNGNSNHTNFYSIEDDSKSNQAAYYRLTQVDFSGEKTVMNDFITFANCNSNESELNVFQDINGQNIMIVSSAEGNISISFFDVSGRLISTNSKNLQVGENKIIASDYNLSSGIYLMNIQTADLSKTNKIIIR